MKNLLEETIDFLERYGKVPEDVLWVGNYIIYFDWENFREASNFEYDDGYGTQEIDPSLKVVGKDWWLERDEYDGAEGWEFKTFPEIPEIKALPKKSNILRKYF